MKKLTCMPAAAGIAALLATAATGAQAGQKSTGLQLSIITPDPTTIGDFCNIDALVKGGQISEIELYIDNALASKRQVNSNQARNIVSFKLDTLLLSVGEHDIVVKAYGPDGKSSSSAVKLKIPALDMSAPVRIAYPMTGTEVAGTVPVKLSLDADMARLKPYVTFFVDKEFKVLRNNPPYEYNWDTTKSTNGWHILEAWSQDADTPQPIKARPIHVKVNNGGGETKLKTDIPDLREPTKAITLTTPKTSASNSRLSDPGSLNGAGNVKGTGHNLATGNGGVMREPSGLGHGVTSQSNSGALQLVGPNISSKRLSPTGSGGAAKQPADRLAVSSSNTKALPPLTNGDIMPIISRVNGSAGVTVRASNRVSQKAAVPAPFVMPDNGTFQVAFNGTPIAFDVKPRVEGGMHLAPFRQIFEHTGGRLYWFGGTAQTVRAVNDAKEIEIKIGNASAKVNSKSVKMDKTPYIESGRTIVPLSFVRDSLDVNVHYNSQTGTLVIESKK